MKRRFLAMLLSLAMVFTMVPVSAAAAFENDQFTASAAGGKVTIGNDSVTATVTLTIADYGSAGDGAFYYKPATTDDTALKKDDQIDINSTAEGTDYNELTSLTISDWDVTNTHILLGYAATKPTTGQKATITAAPATLTAITFKAADLSADVTATIPELANAPAKLTFAGAATGNSLYVKKVEGSSPAESDRPEYLSAATDLTSASYTKYDSSTFSGTASENDTYAVAETNTDDKVIAWGIVTVGKESAKMATQEITVTRTADTTVTVAPTGGGDLTGFSAAVNATALTADTAKTTTTITTAYPSGGLTVAMNDGGKYVNILKKDADTNTITWGTGAIPPWVKAAIDNSDNSNAIEAIADKPLAFAYTDTTKTLEVTATAGYMPVIKDKNGTTELTQYTVKKGSETSGKTTYTVELGTDLTEDLELTISKKAIATNPGIGVKNGDTVLFATNADFTVDTNKNTVTLEEVASTVDSVTLVLPETSAGTSTVTTNPANKFNSADNTVTLETGPNVITIAYTPTGESTATTYEITINKAAAESTPITIGKAEVNATTNVITAPTIDTNKTYKYGVSDNKLAGSFTTADKWSDLTGVTAFTPTDGKITANQDGKFIVVAEMTGTDANATLVALYVTESTVTYNAGSSAENINIGTAVVNATTNAITTPDVTAAGKTFKYGTSSTKLTGTYTTADKWSDLSGVTEFTSADGKITANQDGMFIVVAEMSGTDANATLVALYVTDAKVTYNAGSSAENINIGTAVVNADTNVITTPDATATGTTFKYGASSTKPTGPYTTETKWSELVTAGVSEFEPTDGKITTNQTGKYVVVAEITGTGNEATLVALYVTANTVTFKEDDASATKKYVTVTTTETALTIAKDKIEIVGGKATIEVTVSGNVKPVVETVNGAAPTTADASKYAFTQDADTATKYTLSLTGLTDNTAIVIKSEAVTPDPSGETTVKGETENVTNDKGETVATGEADQEEVNNAIDAALDKDTSEVVLDFSEGGDNADAAAITIPIDSVDKLNENSLDLVVRTPVGSVEVPSETAQEIVLSESEKEDDVKVVLEIAPATVDESLENHEAFDAFDISFNKYIVKEDGTKDKQGEVPITKSLTVSVKSKHASSTSKLVAYLIEGKKKSVVDWEAKKSEDGIFVSFRAPHLTTYAIVPDDKVDPSEKIPSVTVGGTDLDFSEGNTVSWPVTSNETTISFDASVDMKQVKVTDSESGTELTRGTDYEISGQNVILKLAAGKSATISFPYAGATYKINATRSGGSTGDFDVVWDSYNVTGTPDFKQVTIQDTDSTKVYLVEVTDSNYGLFHNFLIFEGNGSDVNFYLLKTATKVKVYEGTAAEMINTTAKTVSLPATAPHVERELK